MSQARLLTKPTKPKSIPRSISRCPMERYRATWCQRLCEPHGQMGACGRPAPHRMMGRIQKAIARYQAREAGV